MFYVQKEATDDGPAFNSIASSDDLLAIGPGAIPMEANHDENKLTPSTLRDFVDSTQVILGTLRRGWFSIGVVTLLCLACGVLVMTLTERAYRATTRLLVLRHGNKPLNAQPSDPGFQIDNGDDYLSTHALILASPMVVGRAIDSIGLRNLPSLANAKDPLEEAIGRLKVSQPDKMAKILRVDFDARGRPEAVEMVDAIMKSYKEFLDRTYHRNNSEINTIIARAKEELGVELDRLEKEYAKHRQERPVLATDTTGRPFLNRRLDHWDLTANELMIKGMRLQGQLELGRKLANQRVGLSAVVHALAQLENNPAALAPGQSPAADSEYLRRLVLESQEATDRLGPSATKVKQIREQIGQLQTVTREARSDLERREVEDLLTSTDESLKSIKAMQSEIALRYEKELDAVKATDRDVLNEANFKATLERRRLLYNSVVDQLRQSELTTDFISISCDAIEPPNASEYPVRPRIALILAISILAGLCLGCVAALTLDRLDARIRSIGEMREALGLSVLGHIPRLLTNEAPTVREVGVFCQSRSRSAFAEAFRSIRTYLDLANRRQKLQVVLVTSPLSSDGKSVVASNLAIILASSGRRILLIDGNLRDPNLAGIHGLRRDIGMLDLLRDHKPLSEIAQHTSIENLDVVTAGLRATSPSELLASPWLEALIKEARQSYDMTIIDSPPMLSVSDASILGSSADGVILVVRSLEMQQDDAMRVSELLRSLETTVLGVVVNAEGAREGTFRLGRAASTVAERGPRGDAEDASDPILSHEQNGRSQG